MNNKKAYWTDNIYRFKARFKLHDWPGSKGKITNPYGRPGKQSKKKITLPELPWENKEKNNNTD